jgi:hypothetical protein
MPHLAEVRRRRRADLPARAVLADQVRKGGFELGIAPHQRVIVRVAEISGASS